MREKVAFLIEHIDRRDVPAYRAALHSLLEEMDTLLDIVEALQRYIGHLDQGRRHIDNDIALDAWDRKVGQNWDLIEDALAALEQDGTE
jgi:hypothetical protein